MTVRELLEILADHDVEINIYKAKNLDEEIRDIDVWTDSFFEAKGGK